MTPWFLPLVLLLAGAHAADGVTSAQAQRRGAWEANTLDYGGHHPTDARLAAVQSAYFAGEAAALWFTGKSQHRAVRWAGRAAIVAFSVYHAGLAVHNSHVCREGTCQPIHPN